MTARPVDVRLTTAEMLTAAICGVLRRVHAISAGRRAAYGIDQGDEWGGDIRGAFGEYAVAKYRGSFWLGPATVGVVTSPDLLDGGQVRWRRMADWDLIIRPQDPDDAPFVLVTGDPPILTLRGWIYARDGKRAEWLDDKGNGRPRAFFVPQSALADMATYPAGSPR